MIRRCSAWLLEARITSRFFVKTAKSLVFGRAVSSYPAQGPGVPVREFRPGQDPFSKDHGLFLSVHRGQKFDAIRFPDSIQRALLRIVNSLIFFILLSHTVLARLLLSIEAMNTRMSGEGPGAGPLRDCIPVFGIFIDRNRDVCCLSGDRSGP